MFSGPRGPDIGTTINIDLLTLGGHEVREALTSMHEFIVLLLRSHKGRLTLGDHLGVSTIRVQNHVPEARDFILT